MSIKPNRHPPPGPTGSTQGLIVPQTAPHASGAGNPAPEPRPEAETQGWWKRWGSDVAHGALDVVGLIPVLGEAADGLNAVIYVAEGDYISAARSAAAMLPVGGQAATAAKFGKKAAEAGIDASRQAAKQGAKQTGKQAGKEVAEEGTEQAAKKAGAGGGGKRNDGGKVEKILPSKDPRYARGKFRKGVREKVWEDAKDPDKKVHDPVTSKEMNYDELWDMGHKPGYEHWKHQQSAAERKITRQDFLNEYNDTSKYRPELPSSNRSHAGELKTIDYFGE